MVLPTTDKITMYFSTNDILPFHQTLAHSQKCGNGYAHSKIILMGEHSVVYNHPAIALPFPAAQAHVRVSASQEAQTQINCVYHQGNFADRPTPLNNLYKAYQLTQQMFNLPQQALDIQIESSIPEERGMGSSAAISVALIRTLCDYYQQPINDKQLRYLANEAEVIAHQSTSGIDTLITSSGLPYIYQKSLPPQSFEFQLDAYLVVADSGLAGQTKKAVGHVADLLEAKAPYVQEIMAAIGRLVREGHQALLDKDADSLGRLMTYNHYYLNQLGVSTTFIDQIVNAAWLAGALGAKLTGGGLGGCVIALARTKDQATKVASYMRQAGAAKTWYLDLNQKLS